MSLLFQYFVGYFVVVFFILLIPYSLYCIFDKNESIGVKCSAICFLTFFIVIFILLLNSFWYDNPKSAPTFIIEKNLRKNLKNKKNINNNLRNYPF